LIQVPTDSSGSPNFHALGAEFSVQTKVISPRAAETFFTADYPQRVQARQAKRQAEAKFNLNQDSATGEELAVIREMGGKYGRHGLEKSRPEYYRCPLRSRARIVGWLKNQINSAGRHHGPFHWDVKLYHLDFSFDNLLKRHQESGYAAKDTDEVYLADCRKRYVALYGADGSRGDLCNQATEEACRGVVELCRNKALNRWELRTRDSYNTLWRDDSIDAKLSFAGRSSSWLVLDSFNGVACKDLDIDDPELDYKFLRQLYEYVTILNHDFGDRRPERAVEDAAAFDFFMNTCGDISTIKDEIGAGI
jgi:hypothetical protein